MKVLTILILVACLISFVPAQDVRVSPSRVVAMATVDTIGITTEIAIIEVNLREDGKLEVVYEIVESNQFGVSCDGYEISSIADNRRIYKDIYAARGYSNPMKLAIVKEGTIKGKIIPEKRIPEKIEWNESPEEK